MKSIVRTIVASTLGIIIAFFVITLTEGLNAKWYPSEHLHPTAKERLMDIKSLPLPSFLLGLTGYIICSFMGGYVAARIAPSDKKVLAAFVVGFLLFLGGLVFFISIPHPLWFAVSVCSSYILFSYLGAKAAIR